MTDNEIFYNKVRERLNVDFFLQIFHIVVRGGVCPKTTPEEWLKILCYMHTKGWIYYKQDEGKITTVLGAYRIKEFDENKIDVMPEEEEGDILYVPFTVSTNKNILVFKKMLENYLKENPSVRELIFYERNSDEKFKRFNLKGESNGKEQESIFTTSANN